MIKVLIISALIMISGCRTGSQVISENRSLCDGHGGVSITHVPHGLMGTRLFFCSDGTVKWGD